MTDLVKKVEKIISSLSLFGRGDRLLLAVSGGRDSMVMLDILVRAGYDCSVAHCNFRLRGVESDEDEDLVRQAVTGYGLRLHSVRFDTYGEMERTGESVQLAARRLRYEWFEKLCDENGYNKIVVAHHLEDSVETFFINLLRGTGLKGLTGIRPVNGRVVRPLLEVTCAELGKYAEENDVRYRDDSSNFSNKYLRNKLRLDIFPLLREAYPSFDRHVADAMCHLGDAEKTLSVLAGEITRGATEEKDGLTYIYPGRIDPRYPQEFILYEIMKGYGFNAATVKDIKEGFESSAVGNKFFSADGKTMACIDRSSVIISPRNGDKKESPSPLLRIDGPGEYIFGDSIFTVELVRNNPGITLKTAPETALLDLSETAFPIVIRKWSAGDRFVPFGMKGFKKVSDFLTDCRVPMPLKEKQLVVEAGGDIIWLVGRRPDDRFRVTGKTDEILRIKVSTK